MTTLNGPILDSDGNVAVPADAADTIRLQEICDAFGCTSEDLCAAKPGPRMVNTSAMFGFPPGTVRVVKRKMVDGECDISFEYSPEGWGQQ